MNKNEVLSHALSFKFGGMSQNELGYLYDLCTGKDVLELGSMVGMSSYVMASVANIVYCVDVWSDNQEHLSHDPGQAGIYRSYLPELPSMFNAFSSNCKEFIDAGKIKVYRGNTKDLHKFFVERTFDVLLIDADHSYQGVSTDFELYQYKIKNDGIIVFHDYGDCMWIDISRFCNEMVNAGKIKMVGQTERIAVFKNAT